MILGMSLLSFIEFFEIILQSILIYLRQRDAIVPTRPVFTNKSNYNNVNSSNKEIVQTNHRYHSRNKLNNNQFQNNRITQQPYANERRNQSNFSIRNRSMSKNNGRPGNHSRSRRRNANGSSVSFNQNGFQW